jgi:pimeloyl-ACP methyl ester carboxylesterase
MNRARKRMAAGLAAALGLAALTAAPSLADTRSGQVVSREIRSVNFSQTRVAISPTRELAIYLPAGYDASRRRYPVIYFLPNPLEKGFRSIFDRYHAQDVFDRAVASGVIGGFILVCVDAATPIGSSWYVNSPVTGNWEDFLATELVSYVDANFRTLPSRDSRGIAGIFMGGYGAIRLAMRHPGVFGSVYAMHPVGTGSGVQIMESRPNWEILEGAGTLDDVRRDGVTTIFTSIFQAFLPDPGKPPLFVDLPAHRDQGQLVIDAGLTKRLRDGFFLESMIPDYAENLKSLRGLRFDWSRNDGNWDHVYANQAFTHKLNEFGIVHEAEEYNGAWGEANWGRDGRIYTEALPFFQRNLSFDMAGQGDGQ